jgi:hypothetical protein
MVAVYGFVKSRHKLPEFMANVTITINVMVRASPPVHLKNINKPFKSGDVTKFNKIDTTG